MRGEQELLGPPGPESEGRRAWPVPGYFDKAQEKDCRPGRLREIRTGNCSTEKRTPHSDKPIGFLPQEIPHVLICMSGPSTTTFLRACLYSF